LNKHIDIKGVDIEEEDRVSFVHDKINMIGTVHSINNKNVLFVQPDTNKGFVIMLKNPDNKIEVIQKAPKNSFLKECEGSE